MNNEEELNLTGVWGRGIESGYMCCNAGYRAHGRIIMTPVAARPPPLSHRGPFENAQGRNSLVRAYDRTSR